MSSDEQQEPVNPYESPRHSPDKRPRGMSERPEPLPDPSGEGWKFAMLGIAILLGCLSLVWWLGIIFWLLSAPLFFRFYIQERRLPPGSRRPPLMVNAAGAAGIFFVVVCVLSASAGACLGTCTLSVYAIVIPVAGIVNTEDAFYSSLYFSLVFGGILGFIVFALSASWLFSREWR